MTAVSLDLTPTSRLSVQALRSFYAQPLARLVLLTTSILLTYGGGAAMFWLHAIHRGEKGPAINHWFHWLSDSTLGFLALTPVLFFILPAALWALARIRGRKASSLVLYGVAVGVLFALATAPGPLLHTIVAGAGTPLADAATNIFGSDPTVAVHHHGQLASHSPLSSSLLQVAVGIPVYVALSSLALQVVRVVTTQRQRPGR